MADYFAVTMALLVGLCAVQARRHVERVARVLRQALSERLQDGPAPVGGGSHVHPVR